MRSAKLIDNDLIRDIYEALDSNNDLTNAWKRAKHIEFARIFGGSLDK